MDRISADGVFVWGALQDCSNGLGLLLRLELRGHGAEVHARLPALADRIEKEVRERHMFLTSD